MFRSTTLFCLIFLFRLSSGRDVNPSKNGIIGASAAVVKATRSLEIPDDSYYGCRWFGKAPFCKGKCPKGWTEELSASSRYPLFSTVPTIEAYFGEPCLPLYKKIFCCITNRQDPTWSGHWASTKTGGLRLCHYDLHGNEKSDEVGYFCGSLKCEKIGYDLIGDKTTVYQITGLNCDTLRDEAGCSVGTATNGTITWKLSEGVVDRWVKHFLPDSLPDLEYE